jgi:hypothetical protein
MKKEKYPDPGCPKHANTGSPKLPGGVRVLQVEAARALAGKLGGEGRVHHRVATLLSRLHHQAGHQTKQLNLGLEKNYVTFYTKILGRKCTKIFQRLLSFQNKNLQCLMHCSRSVKICCGSGKPNYGSGSGFIRSINSVTDPSGSAPYRYGTSLFLLPLKKFVVKYG